MSGRGSRVVSSLWTFVVEDLLVLSVPQRLVIQSPRLGAMLKVGQLASIVLALAYVLSLQQYAEFEAKPGSMNIWKSQGPPMSTLDSEPHYCKTPTPYWYSIDLGSKLMPAYLNFQPTGCRSVANIADFLELDQMGEVFLPTLNQQYRLRNQSNHGNPDCKDTMMDTHCNRQFDESFLLKQPEDAILAFTHGYEVEVNWGKSDPRPSYHVVGNTAFKSYIQMDDGKKTPAGSLLTLIFGANRLPCRIGGKDMWHERIIHGTFREWLACAGINLDSDPNKDFAELESSNQWPSQFRSMGAVLQLTLKYENKHDVVEHDGVICSVFVSPFIQWTYKIHHGQIAIGVLVRLKVTGSYQVFDIQRLITSIVELIVLAQVPHRMMQFIVLYCLGLSSEIYRRALRRRYNPEQVFQNAVIKAVFAEMGFRGMNGGRWKQEIASLDGINRRKLQCHLQAIFQEQLQNGSMEGEHLAKTCAVAFQRLSHSEGDTIRCVDFIKAYLEDDIINLPSLAQLLGNRSKHGWAFMDDARNRLRDAVSHVPRLSEVQWRHLGSIVHLGSMAQSLSSGPKEQGCHTDDRQEVALPEKEEEPALQEEEEEEAAQTDATGLTDATVAEAIKIKLQSPSALEQACSSMNPVEHVSLPGRLTACNVQMELQQRLVALESSVFGRLQTLEQNAGSCGACFSSCGDSFRVGDLALTTQQQVLATNVKLLEKKLETMADLQQRLTELITKWQEKVEQLKSRIKELSHEHDSSFDKLEQCCTRLKLEVHMLSGEVQKLSPPAMDTGRHLRTLDSYKRGSSERAVRTGAQGDDSSSSPVPSGRWRTHVPPSCRAGPSEASSTSGVHVFPAADPPERNGHGVRPESRAGHPLEDALKPVDPLADALKPVNWQNVKLRQVFMQAQGSTPRDQASQLVRGTSYLTL